MTHAPRGHQKPALSRETEVEAGTHVSALFFNRCCGIEIFDLPFVALVRGGRPVDMLLLRCHGIPLFGLGVVPPSVVEVCAGVLNQLDENCQNLLHSND